jgi:hypothetical protein
MSKVFVLNISRRFALKVVSVIEAPAPSSDFIKGIV